MSINIIDTKLEFNSNHQNREGKPKGVALHHAAAIMCSVADVHRWHKANGWAGIGYHFFIRKDGTIYKGRPEEWLGAHTSGYNDYIGICCEGNFETDIISEAQKNSVVNTLKYLYEKYGELTVRRHKDLDSTACPGKNYPFDEIVKLSKEKTPNTDTGNKDVLYRVQVGAFKDKKNAEALVVKLKKDGFDSFVTQNGTLYKVQTGAFKNKTNAENQAKALKAKSYDTYITTESGTIETLKKSIDEIANEVIKGLWGVGEDRANRLTKAGYDYSKVQDRVNQLMK